MVFMDEQDFLDGALLEAHLIELSQETQKLSSLQQSSTVLHPSVGHKLGPCHIVTLSASMLRHWDEHREFDTPKPPAGETSPCSHSSGTSPGLRPPGLHRNPAHTDDLGTAGISGSTSNNAEQIYSTFLFLFFILFFENQ